MKSNPLSDPMVRESIIADPESLLQDADIMRVLVEARDARRGNNVIDLRGVAMQRLEERLTRLEAIHRTVIAAAYENLAGTRMIQRAITGLIDSADLDSFLRNLVGPVAELLRVDCMRLILETETPARACGRADPAVMMAKPGFANFYTGSVDEERKVTLRARTGGIDDVYAEAGRHVRSEACLRLVLGPTHLPALLVMGSNDPDRFGPSQGSDLLNFFADAAGATLRRLLL